MLSRSKKRNTMWREFLSMRTVGESTDWAGTKGECVAGKRTSMGHWLSNTQEGKSCENVVLPANNWQQDFDDFLLRASAVAPFTLDHSSAERPSHNCINTIITTLRFLFTGVATASIWCNLCPNVTFLLSTAGRQPSRWEDIYPAPGTGVGCRKQRDSLLSVISCEVSSLSWDLVFSSRFYTFYPTRVTGRKSPLYLQHTKGANYSCKTEFKVVPFLHSTTACLALTN